MQLNSQDRAIIEQVLREAVNQGHDYAKTLNYRQVLSKMQAMPSQQSDTEMDGIRYDYDDNTTE